MGVGISVSPAKSPVRGEDSRMPLLEVRALRKWFPMSGGAFGRRREYVKAVDGVSFTVPYGETVGLVGESGCGKSTTARVILRLEEPTSGQVLLEGRNVFSLAPRELRHARRDMQIVFQDPYSSLDPRKTVEDIVAEPLVAQGLGNRKERHASVHKMLDMVGLTRDHAERYPHEFSGGQRQRIGIARALVANPKLVILDEPVSALDVSIQSQVLNLLCDLQRDLGVAYLFIAHDLSVVRHISREIGVMYLGKLVEFGPAEEVFEHPLHPYTQALISAIPIADPDFRRERIVLEGDVPSPIRLPSGCRFHTRCWKRTSECKTLDPEMRHITQKHGVACHLFRGEMEVAT